MRRGRRMLLIILGVLLVLIGLVLIWYNISYSPLKSKFRKDLHTIIGQQETSSLGKFTEEDFQHLPLSIQKNLAYTGFIGYDKMRFFHILYPKTAFKQGKKGPSLIIDYDQYNFAEFPIRLAFIDTKMFGIPFQGYDSYLNGHGGMKGVLAKVFTLFNEKSSDMDKAALVTYLAEILFLPSAILTNDIIFKEIDDYHVKAKLTYLGVSAEGIFTFNEKFEMVSFTTNERGLVSNGKTTYLPWVAKCSDYCLKPNGLKLPTNFQAIWQYDDDDLIYFDGIINNINYF